MFLLETVVKVCAFGLAFLRLGWEIFDAVVVLVAFTLDVLLQHSHSSANGFGLVIILRLWRVARILNGICAVSIAQLLPIKTDVSFSSLLPCHVCTRHGQVGKNPSCASSGM